MIDITELPQDGRDMGVADSIAPKGANVLLVQLGELEYAPDFGVDKKFFLESEFQFQKESYKAYLVQRLTEHQVNVAGIDSVIKPLFERETFSVGDLATKSKGLVI